MIDSHLHLWTLDTFVAGGVRHYSWLGPQHGALFRSFGEDEARETLDAAGVRGAVLVQADDSVADTESVGVWCCGVDSAGLAGGSGRTVAPLHGSSGLQRCAAPDPR
ncbi:hypothetical protein AAU01_36280 [Paenarthrobacter aurescens]|uniref:Amidohydrolase-related domain-containing protein n=1 Tax=Paenarthrobacter aurescens TaxID=43663 RepID=A0A4Y3NI31_PAEAU|nr:hypothetical protein AAU01_36280 [Paenarthrobacter aurescens]